MKTKTTEPKMITIELLDKTTLKVYDDGGDSLPNALCLAECAGQFEAGCKINGVPSEIKLFRDWSISSDPELAWRTGYQPFSGKKKAKRQERPFTLFIRYDDCEHEVMEIQQ